MAVRQYGLYLAAVSIDCVCECRFMNGHSQPHSLLWRP